MMMKITSIIMMKINKDNYNNGDDDDRKLQ